MKKKIIIKAFLYLYILFLTSLLSAWAVYHVVYGNGAVFGKKISQSILAYASIPSKIKGLLTNREQLLNERLIPDKESRDGFYYLNNYKPDIKGSILISTFEDDGAIVFKQFQIATGDKIHQWLVNKETIRLYDKTINLRQLRMIHPLLLKDKSIVVSLGAYNSLMRIDSVGKVLWFTREPVHHDIEQDAEGNIWMGSCASESYYFNKSPEYKALDDQICQINVNTGKVMFKKSIQEILMENNYAYLLAIGKFEYELTHLNDVQPALLTTKYWNAGDLLISLRNKSTVFLYRPSTNKIIWLKTGPWSCQHDCDFADDHTIMVYGNDLIRGPMGEEDVLFNKTNNEYFYDFSTGKVSTPYEKLFKKEKISTQTEGLAELLPDGNILIDETNKGRVIIGDTAKAKIIFTVRADKKYIKMLNLTRYIPD